MQIIKNVSLQILFMKNKEIYKQLWTVPVKTKQQLKCSYLFPWLSIMQSKELLSSFYSVCLCKQTRLPKRGQCKWVSNLQLATDQQHHEQPALAFQHEQSCRPRKSKLIRLWHSGEVSSHSCPASIDAKNCDLTYTDPNLIPGTSDCHNGTKTEFHNLPEYLQVIKNNE